MLQKISRKLNFKSAFMAVVLGGALSPFAVMAEMQKDAIGKVYEIAEPSALVVLMKRLHAMQEAGEIDRMQEEFKKQAIETMNNPVGINLPRNKEHKAHYFDPSIVIRENIYLHDGTILHKAGTKVSPLSVRSLSKKMVFIDARDEEQVLWAHQIYKDSLWQDKIILVAGSYLDLMKEWQKPVFFDQRGGGGSAINTPDGMTRETLVQKFGIKGLPAVVSQEGLYLRIDEVAI